MHKVIRIFLLAWLVFISQASSAMSVTYKTLFRSIDEDKVCKECENVLDIDDSVSCFYNYKDYRESVVDDSLSRLGYNPYEILNEELKQKLLVPTTTFEVFKNFPVKGKLTFTYFIWDNFVYEEKMPEFEWTLIDKDTTVLGYQAYMAKTTYRGRTWVVYYAPDIPVSDGPWKLSGLPGLILYAKDTKGDFLFEAIGISNSLQRSPLKLKAKSYKQCTPKELAKLIVIDQKDPQMSMQQVWGFHGVAYDAQGRRMASPNKTACLIEYP